MSWTCWWMDLHVWKIKTVGTWSTPTPTIILPVDKSLLFLPSSFITQKQQTHREGLDTAARQSHHEITCSSWVNQGNQALVSRISEKVKCFQNRKLHLLLNSTSGSSSCPLWILAHFNSRHYVSSWTQIIGCKCVLKSEHYIQHWPV